MSSAMMNKILGLSFLAIDASSYNRCVGTSGYKNRSLNRCASMKPWCPSVLSDMEDSVVTSWRRLSHWPGGRVAPPPSTAVAGARRHDPTEPVAGLAGIRYSERYI